jgi:PST family polysaccharide transporter
MSWWDSFYHAGGMVRLGLAFMWSGLLAAASGYVTRVMITQKISLEAVGIFSAAFALSGMFVNFIFSAMGSDYYPRLTAVSSDPDAMNRLINEQTEIGVLLAVPGILATLSFSPWIVQIFYTAEFLPATDLLQWFILGCAVRILSWPLGYVILALGKGYWFFLTCTFIELSHIVLIWFGLTLFGVEGSAFAYFMMCLLHLFLMYGFSRYWTGFLWSASNKRLVLMAVPIIFIAFIAVNVMSLWYSTFVGVLVSLISSIYCLRALVQHVGKEQRIIRLASYIPGVAYVCGLK